MWINMKIYQLFMYDYELSNEASGERPKTKEFAESRPDTAIRLQA
jgi:hypothetical protein